jgi:hypothetical protein
MRELHYKRAGRLVGVSAISDFLLDRCGGPIECA